jgi:hypothetical protein
MFYNLKKRIVFPEQIKEAFKTVNEARKLAAHRKLRPITNEDSINALYGATKFIIWYNSEYKLNPSRFSIN